ncbi:uroporphyrinogen-III C-methyltransferase [Thalassoroseus pseudoceratinae]|uniref:uroporphyrinogen-III C-methyltransferase n=1 Tax=Thalassoroseus pseudoceratinae TaxID=2713176 RepID=UPI00141F7AF4|nr:uroporphyrinogen-III C-methyltransferase [Thalassoroseus pseudoceratinae]
MTNPGTVYLVGAGSGDPGLISLRGVECLRQADVVLYDGLVNPLILRHTRASAERTSRAMGPDGRRIDQAEINQRLIDAAKAGHTVVRLKGGDPFIFGRGSEEAAALAAEGIPFEVVPGVTAAVAAGEYAGISLTHRNLASAVAFITGHEDPTKSESSLDYNQLAAFRGTLVFYMGLHRLPKIAAALIEAGKDPATPACVISRATTPLQRTVTAPLQDLPETVAAAMLQAPSLIIVGECVSQREQIAWFERKPLFGKSIGITRPIGQTKEQISQCLALGARPVLLPTIEITSPENWQTVDDTIARIDKFDWLIFTSTNGVQSYLDRLWQLGYDSRRLANVKIAAIGPSTAGSLEAYHLRADVVPEEYRAEALAESLKPLAAGQRVLWAGANRGREVLIDELTAIGATVEKLVVYHNHDATTFPEAEQALLEAGGIDWIGLSSPSIARNLRDILGKTAEQHLGNRIRLAAISPVTASAAAEVGLPVATVATEYTWQGIFNAIQAFEESSPSEPD